MFVLRFLPRSGTRSGGGLFQNVPLNLWAFSRFHLFSRRKQVVSQSDFTTKGWILAPIEVCVDGTSEGISMSNFVRTPELTVSRCDGS